MSAAEPVVEHARLRIDPDERDRFEAVLREAVRVLSAATGFRSAEVLRGVEDPSTYSVEVRWRTLEDHTVGFRDSELLTRWRALVGPFLVGPPDVSHLVRVLHLDDVG